MNSSKSTLPDLLASILSNNWTNAPLLSSNPKLFKASLNSLTSIVPLPSVSNNLKASLISYTSVVVFPFNDGSSSATFVAVLVVVVLVEYMFFAYIMVAVISCLFPPAGLLALYIVDKFDHKNRG